MRDHNKQEHAQAEVTYQTLSEFLQSTPPNQRRHISDLSVKKVEHIGPTPYGEYGTQHT